MPTEPFPQELRAIEAFLARDEDALARATQGAAELEEELRLLARGLETPQAPAPLMSATLHAARVELAARRDTGALLRGLLRLVLATALPVALVVTGNLALLQLAPELLARWLPEPLPRLLPGAYVFGALGWLALVYGSLPALAHIEVTRRQREALA